MLERSGIVKRNLPVSPKQVVGYSWHSTLTTPRPRPFPRRRTERRDVTIAAGFRCNEGVVICADTEITIGDIRQHEGKITTSIYEGLSHIVSFAGAGWTDYIRTAIENAQEGLSECSGMKEIRAHLKEKLIQFFEGHLANWAYFPAAERPFVELLVGVTTKDGSFDLFYSSGTSFYSTWGKAIGSGIILANNLISEYRYGNESLDELCRLAVFIISRVKDQVIGCGGQTHLVALRKVADFAFVEDNDVERLESEIKKISKDAHTKFVEAINQCHPLRLLWLRKVSEDESKSGPSTEP